MATKISEGAMTLTLDAERLYKALDKLGEKSKEGGEKAGKGFQAGAGESFKFGVFASLGAKAIEGLAKGFETIISKAGEFKEKISAGEMQVSPVDSQAINVSATAIERIGKGLERLLIQVIGKLGPTFTMVADAFEEMEPSIKPVIDWLGSALEQIMSIGIEVFFAIKSAVATVIEVIEGWIGKTFDLGDTWTTVQDVIVGIMRVIGKVGAYAFDIIAAAMGVVAIGVGLLIRAFGNLIDLFRRVVSLAKELPDELRPPGLDRFIAGVEDTSATVLAAGHNVQNWGEKQLRTFGDSAKKVDGIIDGIANRARARLNKAKDVANQIEAIQAKYEYKPVAAVQAGSAELASIQARFTSEFMFNPKLEDMRKEQAELQKKQLEEQKKGNKHLERLGLDKWSLM